jgi:hypothetical protein
MTFNPRQTALFRPAAVAIHDHRHVSRQIRGGLGAEMWSGTHRV